MKVILLIVLLMISCGGGKSNQIPEPVPTPSPTAAPTPVPTAVPEPLTNDEVWEIYTDCLGEEEGWNEKEYIQPIVRIVDAPCNRLVAGCLTKIYLSTPRGVGEIEVMPNYNNVCTIVHEMGHSVNLQRHGIVDKRHKGDLFNSEFSCFRANLFEECDN